MTINSADAGVDDGIYYRHNTWLPTSRYFLWKAREAMFSLFMKELEPSSSTVRTSIRC